MYGVEAAPPPIVAPLHLHQPRRLPLHNVIPNTYTQPLTRALFSLLDAVEAPTLTRHYGVDSEDLESHGDWCVAFTDRFVYALN